MDGITGLNPQVAQLDLEEFTRSMYYVQEELYDEFLQMMWDLSLNWFSPKAVEFGSNYIPRLSDLLNSIMTRADHIRQMATDAYNNLATSNGIGAIDSFYPETRTGNYFTNTTFKEAGDSGVVGMDVEKVKGTIVPNGYHGIKAALAKFDDVPLTIAFYDPDGEMKAKYKTIINMLKMDAMNLVNEIVRTIMTALEEEQAIIVASKEEAANAMNTAQGV